MNFSRLAKGVVFFLASFAVACVLLRGGPSTTALPEKRPADFVIVASVSGGMVPFGTSTTLGNTGSSFREFDHGITRELALAPTPAQLDALWRTIHERRFDLIRRDERGGVLHDAGGTSLTLTANGKTWTAGADATGFVAESSRADYDAVSAAVGQLAGELLRALEVDVVLEIDPSFQGKEWSITLDGRRPLVPPGKLASLRVPFRVLPGTHDVQVSGEALIIARVELRAGSVARVSSRAGALDVEVK